MGDELFYLLLLPFLLWRVGFGLGARLTVFFLLASYINTDLKDLFQQPRPFTFNSNVALSRAAGYGLPSGHAQSAILIWGSTATWGQNKSFWILAIGLMALIGFSHVYLGVHFPTDVLAGWAIGILLLGLYQIAEPRLENWLTASNLTTQIVIALAVPLALLLIHPTRQTIAALASLAGTGVGLALTNRYVTFGGGGPWWQRVCRFLVGGVVILALYVGLKTVFPGEGSALYLVFRFIQYFFVGLGVTLGAPWFFRLLTLAPAERSCLLR
jgi:undecaprenyl-diphosphatase